MAEEHCWAITQAAERVLEFGFRLVSLVHIFDYLCPQFTLAPYLTCAGELSASCYSGIISWKGDPDTQY